MMELVLLVAAWLLALVVFVGFWLSLAWVATRRSVRRRQRALELRRRREAYGWSDHGHRRLP